RTGAHVAQVGAALSVRDNPRRTLEPYVPGAAKFLVTSAVRIEDVYRSGPAVGDPDTPAGIGGGRHRVQQAIGILRVAHCDTGEFPVQESRRMNPSRRPEGVRVPPLGGSVRGRDQDNRKECQELPAMGTGKTRDCDFWHGKSGSS